MSGSEGFLYIWLCVSLMRQQHPHVGTEPPEILTLTRDVHFFSDRSTPVQLKTLKAIQDLFLPLTSSIYKLDQWSVNDGPWAKIEPTSWYVNKVLLVHNHTHSFTYYL